MKIAIIIGLNIVAISIFGMLICHEFAISGITFIIGLIIVGFTYAKLQKNEGTQIDIEQVNKNIQSFNDFLWGKKE